VKIAVERRRIATAFGFFSKFIGQAREPAQRHSRPADQLAGWVERGDIASRVDESDGFREALNSSLGP